MSHRAIYVSLLCLGLGAAPAWAQPQAIASIDFTGDTLSSEQLRALLALHVGEPYQPEAARRSLDLLYQTGRYASIAIDEANTPGGLALTFRLKRQTLVTSWEFRGNDHLSAQVLTRLLDLSWGQPFNQRQFETYAAAIAERYQREGFFHVRTSLFAEPTGENAVRLVAMIEEGPPLTLSGVEFLNPGPLGAEGARRALGLNVGDRLSREALLSGLDRLEQSLSAAGYLSGRVHAYFRLPDGKRQDDYAALVAESPRDVSLVLAVDAGAPAIVAVDADELLSSQELAKAVSVYSNRSYSPYELDFSAEKLRKLYVSQGYAQARVNHDVLKQPDGSYRIVFHVYAGPREEVAAIDVVGNRTFSSDALRARLQTHRAGFLDRGAFDPEVWAQDVAGLEAFYQSQGFLQAKVTGLPPEHVSAERLALGLRVDEGAQTRVSRLLFAGATPALEAGILQSISLNPGDPYNPARLDEYVSSVEAFLAKSGYPLARVAATFVPGASPEDGAVRFSIQLGPKKVIGAVVLRGNIKTQDGVLRRQFVVKTGRPYDAEEILRTQQQIYQLGFFDRVVVRPLDALDNTPGRPVDLLVEVHERETGSLGIGGGYGDQEGPQLSAEYLESNLSGTGRPLRLEGTLSSRRSGALFSLRDPSWLGTRMIGESGFSYGRETTPDGLTQQTYGPILGLSRPLGEGLLGSLRYSWSRTNYLVVPPGALASDRTNSLVAAALTYDTRSDLLSPRWGTKSDFSVELATPLLGGTLLYARPHLSLAHFWPLPKRVTFAFGAEAGYIQPFGATTAFPTDLLFIGRGASGLRGFDLLGLPGPTGMTGGRMLAISHLELRFPLWNDLGGVAFCDLGQVGSGFGDFSPAALKTSLGLGLRYQTPVGPVRLDWGMRMRPQLEPGLVSFGLGQAF